MAFDFKDIAKAVDKLKNTLDKDGDGIDINDIRAALGTADGVDLNGILNKLKSFGSLKDLSPDDEKVQSKVAELKKSLGSVYGDAEVALTKIVSGITSGDIKKKVDGAAGSGTADFIKKAIEKYLK